MSVDTRLRIALAALLAAVGCSGEDSSAPPEAPPALPAGQAFTLGGTVTYDFVPATYSTSSQTATLAFGASTVRPVRNAKVQVRQGTAGTVLAETVTSESGAYSLQFTPGPSGALVVAALAETATPSIRVEDNTDSDAVWAVGQPIADASPTRNLHAPHGWNGTAYVAANRIAAPFAILDSMYTATRRFTDIRTVTFPPLKVNWSPNNTSQCCNRSLGQITTSHYDGSEIYILGMAGVDTDEFDSHVIVHEWGHYFEDKLSRSDSPGGPHGPGDLLDPRLAFGEGYGNAIAAILLPESMYVDTSWAANVLTGFGFDAEAGADPLPGPFSEMSILRALYDLYDGANETHDTIALGLGPIYDVLVGPQKSTDALTTIGSFVTGLKAHSSVSASVAAVNTVLAAHGIGAITDQWGAGDGNLRAMFHDLALNASSTVQLSGGYDGSNKWNWIQYYVVTGTGQQLTVTGTSTIDIGLEAYRLGNRVGVADQFQGGANPVTEAMRFASVNGAKYVVVLTGYETTAGEFAATVSVTSP